MTATTVTMLAALDILSNFSEFDDNEKESFLGLILQTI